MAIALLSRELYTVGEAARLLRVPPRTLMNWLDGYERRGTRYPPVVRTEPTGSEILTWAEFVESALLAEYRRNREVPLQHIRPVVDALREKYGVPYPLAHFKPYVADRELVIEVQEAERVPRSVQLVVHRKEQLVLNAPAESFFAKVGWDDDVARYLYPAGKGSLVRIDPAHNFGLPEVQGFRTEVLFELFEAGDSIEMIADGYDLTTDEVQEAIRFESTRHRRDPEPEPEAEAA